ncbi:MAG: CPBP family intramembrane glutamic endopeptidase [Marmoricola sp.]
MSEVQGQVPPRKQVLALTEPHPESETYPHILRTFDWQMWPGRFAWRPLVGSALLMLTMFFIAPLILTPLVLLPGALIENGTKGLGGYLSKQMSLEVLSPSAFLFLNLTLASAIVASGLLLRYLHRLRFGWLWSVVARFRWRYFWACIGLSVVALSISLALSYALDSSGMSGTPAPFDKTMLALSIVLVLTTPLQAMGEEFAFRGYLMLATGSMLGSLSQRFGLTAERARKVGTVLAVLTTALIFAAFHGVQNFPLFFDRFAFGLIAGILVVRTGGLEAGIALHIINNWVAFAFSIAFGDVLASLQITEIPWSNIWVTLAQSLTYLALADWVARRMQLVRRTAAWRGSQ